eukprot:10103837-Alexandrium_andersonii.AAC.1
MPGDLGAPDMDRGVSSDGLCETRVGLSPRFGRGRHRAGSDRPLCGCSGLRSRGHDLSSEL